MASSGKKYIEGLHEKIAYLQQKAQQAEKEEKARSAQRKKAWYEKLNRQLDEVFSSQLGAEYWEWDSFLQALALLQVTKDKEEQDAGKSKNEIGE